MKKVALGALITVTLLFLAGCSNPDTAAIEGGVWKMSTVQQGEDGSIAYTGTAEEQTACPDAVFLDLTCTVQEGTLVIRQNQSGEQWKAQYAPQGSENLYTVTFEEGGEALAACSKTRYASGEERDTLILSTGEYALTFYRE